ncbi:MAG: hypothetical protein ACI8X5_001132 [Planctomycetota bacterium]|jgi:hypothetical protein
MRRYFLLLLAALALAGPSCKILAGLPAKRQLNEVIVIGTEHRAHLGNEVYTLESLEQILRRADPRYVLCEIPPDRFDHAWKGFVRSGEVSEPRVMLYPEFTEVLFPMALEGRYRMIPCSAWTESMAKRRRLLLEQWKTTRSADTRKVDDAQEKGNRQLEKEGLDDDPLAIHTARFDELVAESMVPYEELFSRDLGAGGWTQINLAHYTLISEALDEISGNGQRVIVMFGSQHKYRLRELLAQRDDIKLLRLGDLE